MNGSIKRSLQTNKQTDPEKDQDVKLLHICKTSNTIQLWWCCWTILAVKIYLESSKCHVLILGSFSLDGCCECWWGKWGFWLDWILRDWFLSQNLLFATPLLLRDSTNWLWSCEPNANVEFHDAMAMLPMQFARTSTYSQMWVVFGTFKQ